MSLRMMGLPNLTFRIGARGVEIAQADGTQIEGGLAVGQQAFANQFGLAVRIDRGQRMILADRQFLRCAVDRRRTREDQIG